jgi:methylmalonyl-CoA/ethylmalonyl-CoA epimerase
MVLRIDHVSIAVKDYDKANVFFTKLLGLVPGGAGEDRSSKYRFQIYSAGDLSRLELIAPTGRESFLGNFLKDREGGVHHITFEVPDINAARIFLEKEKIPYFGFNDKFENWKELFIHPSNAFGVLIQFAEFNPNEWIGDSEAVQNGKEWEISRDGDDFMLSLSHPGGGRVDKHLSGEEIDRMIKELIKIRSNI